MRINDELYNKYRLCYLMCRQTLNRLHEDEAISDEQYRIQSDQIINAPSGIENALPYLEEILENLRNLYIKEAEGD